MKNYLPILILGLTIGCNPHTNSNVRISEVKQETISKHIKKLASDEFLGRKPCTEGEQKTVEYLKEEFLKLGLLPANGDSFFQTVPLIEISGTPSKTMTISNNDNTLELNYFDDFVVRSEKIDSLVSLEKSELVFAGYGIVAPEYNWNDYEAIDWKGKTAVVLINDPGFKSGDSTFFKGNDLTYYGRWTYKYEEAAKQGADGIIIIHETEPASYGWNVVQSSQTGSKLILESDLPVTKMESWISKNSADKLFQMSTLKNKNYKELAKTKGFKPIPLGLTVSLNISNKIKKCFSRNVAAMLPGTGRKDEYIIYSAHWDHFGVGRPIDNDSIYNGAVDNATGTACLLAIAETFKSSGPTKRTIVFLAVTAEEQGLLGSAFYAKHPLFPPDKTVLNINMDAFNSPGPMKDLTIIGFGQSEMDDYAKSEAAKQGRYIIPDPEPEKGNFFRSDHFSFARIGIPVFYAKGTYEGVNISVENIKKFNEYYTTNIYHQPADEYDAETTNLSGVQFDAQLLFQVGYKLSNEDYFPKWYDKSEYKVGGMLRLRERQ